MIEVHDAIARIEERIEELADAAERSRKLVLAGKLAGWAGAALALVTLTGLANLTPTAFVVGLTGCLGGIAMAGSSSSTLDQTLAEIAELERRRREAIDGIGLRVIPGGRV
jgi:hypothetical protein